jgi:hypothetical protein
MHETDILISGRDVLLVAIPTCLMLFISVFRLDHFLATPRSNRMPRRAACGIDKSGEPILCDPDGRRSRPRQPNRVLNQGIERKLFQERQDSGIASNPHGYRKLTPLMPGHVYQLSIRDVT